MLCLYDPYSWRVTNGIATSSRTGGRSALPLTVNGCAVTVHYEMK